MDDKIANSIAHHQAIINELQDVKEKVKNNVDDKVKVRIETTQIFRIWEPYLTKTKNKFDLSPSTMFAILDQAIAIERERINKLIDMEIDKRLSEKK